jgi:hypothetical protein
MSTEAGLLPSAWLEQEGSDAQVRSQRYTVESIIKGVSIDCLIPVLARDITVFKSELNFSYLNALWISTTTTSNKPPANTTQHREWCLDIQYQAEIHQSRLPI